MKGDKRRSLVNFTELWSGISNNIEKFQNKHVDKTCQLPEALTYICTIVAISLNIIYTFILIFVILFILILKL